MSYYITMSDLIQILTLICVIIDLVVSVRKNTKK